MTHSSSTKRVTAVVVALGLALGSVLAASTVPGGAAQAAPSQAQQGSTLLFLSTSGNQDFAGRQPFTGIAILLCEPPAGLHPRPADACRDLAAVGGDFANLPGIDGVGCADYYQPVAVSAFGWWKGRLVTFNRTHSNMCYLYRAAGFVFPLPGGYGDQPGAVTSTTIAN